MKLEGIDVKSGRWFLLCMFLAASMASSAQDFKDRSTTLAEPELQQLAATQGSTCSQQEVIRVPHAVASRARVKARLISLLRLSLLDDAKGVVNVSQEKEIRKLANELRKEENLPQY